MEIQRFYDPPTGARSYVVRDGHAGVVIDPTRDYDAKSARTRWGFAEQIAAHIDRAGIELLHAVDTHAHADHLSDPPFFVEWYGARSVTGSRVGEVQRVFRDLYGLGDTFPVDGSRLDLLLDAGAAPAPSLPALQVNIRAGALPEPDANGIVSLRIPLDTLAGPR